MAVLPTEPARKRKTISMGRLVETAQAMVKIRKRSMERT